MRSGYRNISGTAWKFFAPDLSPYSSQPLVPIAEAQALTGLSREVLKDAIASGDLKAKQIGKGWRVKRSDLQEYIEKLF